MDEHRLRFERSLALHTAVAERLRSNPDILREALRRLDEWIARGGTSTPLLHRWKQILALPLDDVIAALTDRSEEAAWLRKASPFAGFIEPRERERILRETRTRLESVA